MKAIQLKSNNQVVLPSKAVAALLGVSEQRICQLRQEGKLPREVTTSSQQLVGNPHLRAAPGGGSVLIPTSTMCALLGVTRAAVTGMIQEGRLPRPCYRAGRERAWSAADLARHRFARPATLVV